MADDATRRRCQRAFTHCIPEIQLYTSGTQWRTTRFSSGRDRTKKAEHTPQSLFLSKVASRARVDGLVPSVTLTTGLLGAALTVLHSLHRACTRYKREMQLHFWSKATLDTGAKPTEPVEMSSISGKHKVVFHRPQYDPIVELLVGGGPQPPHFPRAEAWEAVFVFPKADSAVWSVARRHATADG